MTTDATATEPTKIWFLLDRSGSMGSLTQDVIGGFNTFTAEQSTEPGSAHLTLVQFDSQDPFEVIHDAVRIDEVPELTTETYSPRGSTPLLDAIGELIEHADRRIEARSRGDRPVEDQLVVIFSDGLENASRRYNRAAIAELIRERQEAAWEFVFMGANQDSYLEAGRIGFARESISNFAADERGTSAAFESISRATREYRGKTRMERSRDLGTFYGGTREAEIEMGSRSAQATVPELRQGIPYLERAAIGRPITRLGISLFPVYLPGNDLPEIATGANSGLVIEELPASAVPFLKVTNPTNRPVLIPEGEQLIGGLQDRVLNTSVLVAPSTRLDIPVSCLEQGRWGDRREFDRGRAFAPRRARRAKNASVADSLRRGGSRRSDQAAVWNAIDRELAHLRVESRTRAARDAEGFLRRDRRRAGTVEGLARRGPLPGQCGVVVTHGRRVVAIEVFGNHDLLLPHWEGLVRSHLMERPTANGYPSATRALHRIRPFAQGLATANRGVGIGTELHMNDRRTVGQALVHDGAIVHASGFMIG
ncbi:ARPP-1 family domain-containing protein [Candidatus Spongiisocius sp.]|uniref:ARPP-1 family domain-containing protein n=1 Tax=Candidatus Spongiisocius sp. TaxID=3101273 RepID=UPI003B5C226F